MRKLIIIFLTVPIFFACKTSAPIPQAVQEVEVVEVIEPVFEIISIVILQADLVNTQFETVLKIDNPNRFPVELSTLKYELFGNGLFWADGIENDIFRVAAQSSLETKFNFSMNFINMNRKLLDDIIAMRQVQYLFKGDALVRANAPGARSFKMDYNCTGLSEVKKKS
jgi:LEA14-like dessication related protein